MLVIPAIDIINNKVVRLKKGDYDNPKFYNYDLFDLTKLYLEHGFKLIHIVDLFASRDESISVIKLLEQLILRTNIRVQFGGGIRNLAQVETLLNIGVQRIIIGSLSVTNKKVFEEIVKHFTAQNIVVSVDVLEEKIMIKGWTENSNINIYEHINYCASIGIKKFLCTDISRDGMLGGSNIFLYEQLLKKYEGIELIASGGVSSLQDLLSLQKIGVPEVVVGKALYENKIKLEELNIFAN